VALRNVEAIPLEFGNGDGERRLTSRWKLVATSRLGGNAGLERPRQGAIRDVSVGRAVGIDDGKGCPTRVRRCLGEAYRLCQGSCADGLGAGPRCPSAWRHDGGLVRHRDWVTKGLGGGGEARGGGRKRERGAGVGGCAAVVVRWRVADESWPSSVIATGYIGR